MAAKILPDADVLRQLLNYDPETGELRHRQRPTDHFQHKNRAKAWNSRWAGKIAASPTGTTGYSVVRIHARTYLAHRVAWKIQFGVDPPLIDHINGNTLDNRILNLRAATSCQNQANSKLPSTNTTGIKGVHFDKSCNRYMAHIRVAGKSITIGRFSTIEEAAKARREAAIKYHGEFARF